MNEQGVGLGWVGLARIIWVLISNVGESSCNFGDGTDQGVQSLMFINVASSTYNFQCNRSMHTILFVAYMLYYRLEMKYVYIYMSNVKFLFSSEIAVQE